MRFCELLQGESLLWPSTEAAEETVRSLVQDSRKAEAGALFFCLPGAKHDGHDFAAEAYGRGCRHFVVERCPALPADACLLYCRDVREKMAELCARYYGEPCRALTLIGITGTKGKTTTSLMLYDFLRARRLRVAYIGSLGVYIEDKCYETANTTPDSLTLYGYLEKIRRAGIGIVVMEVSSQALAQKRVHGIPFSYAAFTNLTRDHIGRGEHADFGEYREAKLSLFCDHTVDTAVLNSGDPFSFEIAKKTAARRVLFFGSKPHGGLYAEQLRPLFVDNTFFTEFSLVMGEGHARVRIPFAGAHYVEDFLAALTLVSAYTGMPPSAFLPYAATLQAPGRCQVVPLYGHGVFVLDYAHNGASLAAALKGLRPYVTGKLYCLFGAVGERTGCRRRDMAVAACRHADFSVISEDDSGSEDPAAIIGEIYAAFPDKARAICIRERAAAIEHLFRIAKDGDVVLLAGKGNEQFQRGAKGRIPFSELDILRHLATFSLS